MARLEYANNPYGVPATEAAVDERVAFLRKVAGLSFVGLCISGATSLLVAGAIMVVPALSQGWVPMILMLGAMFASRAVGSSMVHNENNALAMTGFALGTGLQGVAMGYLILSAIMLSVANFGNPFVLLAEAAGLVALTILGMVVYLLTGPKKLSMVGGFLSAVSLPMMVAMVASFAFPSLFGGVFGLIFNVVFIGISAAGLLYSLNNVMHTMSTKMVIPAAYYVTMGILTLFWNILVLLMRLQRR